MTLNKVNKTITILTTLLILCGLVVACGGGSGGGGSSSDTTIQGTLGTTPTRALAEGSSGISDVTVSALGDSSTTDGGGNFSLNVDGSTFTGGPVAFTLSGNGVDGTAVFDNVAGGAGTTAFIDLMVDSDGNISGISSDSSGNVLSEIGSAASGCTETRSFSDGGGGNLWKPVSESTGTVVVLMPAEFRNASFDLLNANGDSVAHVIRQGCCDHNGGRDHRWLSRSAGSLAGEALPLTVRYTFSSERVVCLEVGSPTSRLD